MMLTRSLFVIGVLFLSASTRDEGQWLPGQIREMDWDKLAARGMKLTKDQFWHPEKGGVLSAAVQIGGCSASFCSAEGLVVTNHHCGFEAIQKLSTVAKNYVHDGFVAENREAELPAPGMTVQIVRRIENVTEAIHRAAETAKSDADRADLVQKEIRRLVAEGEKAPDTVCHVASFLHGTEYHLYHRTRISDVRLVYAPPRSVGEFGGEIDNWEWPRHTGDFTFFRAYVGQDGKPKPFDKANVPFKPEHWLKTSKAGVKEGDLALVLGYPGRTERYASSAAVRAREEIFYPNRWRILTAVIKILEDAGKSDPAKALELSSTIKGLANSQKNAEGMVKGLPRNRTVERKAREEEEFSKWVEATPERQKKYGRVLADVLALNADATKFQERDVLLGLVLGRLTPLLTGLANVCDTLPAEGATESRPASTRRELESPALTMEFDSIQLPLMILLLEEAKKLPDSQRISAIDKLLEGSAAGQPLAPGAILSPTAMRDPKARVELFRGGRSTVTASTDPLVVLARGLAADRKGMIERQRSLEGRWLVVGPAWIAAQQEWRGKSFYPDANSTLRVSIATVKGYSPKDGVVCVPHTTVAGILQKSTGKEPFECPPSLVEAAKTRSKSSFFEQKLGDVPVCFLTDADTTGGNSGSPIINGNGELVGLNFDRVFESIPGDFGWSAERSRNICVDVRFVLWFLESVIPAPHLLRELGV